MSKRFLALSIFCTLLLASQIAGAQSETTAVFAPEAEVTSRLSLAENGAEGNDHSGEPYVSANGRYVVFQSAADNLVPDDDNDAVDIFWLDRETGDLRRVSVNSDGEEGNFDSTHPAVSDDGQIIAFQSNATNLIDGDSNNVSDVFYHDLRDGRTRRASRGSSNALANDVSYAPDISDDGHFIVFHSYASNLVTLDTNDSADVFRFSTISKNTIRVSVADDDSQATSDSFNATISANGERIVFESVATNLVNGDTNGYKDIFMRDTLTRETIRVSEDDTRGQGNGDSMTAEISDNGRYVTFASFATSLVSNDSNSYADVFVWDKEDGNIDLVSKAFTGQVGDERSVAPSISSDGRYIVFQSQAKNFSDRDNESGRDVFLHDRTTRETTLISKNNAGEGGIDGSFAPMVAANGRFIVFASQAFNLVTDDGNFREDVFLHDLDGAEPPPPQTVTIDAPVGAPDSEFGLVGENFEPNVTLVVFINSVAVGVATPDPAGRVTVRICTEPSTSDGLFVVRLQQGEIGRSVTFEISRSAATHLTNTAGITYCVGSIAPLIPRNYLPFIF